MVFESLAPHHSSIQLPSAHPRALDPSPSPLTLRRSKRPAAGGAGLQAAYFNNPNFTDLKLTRTDPSVNFNWGKAAPAPSIGANSFSVRWTGKVQPRYSEVYTFSTKSDDGIRLWVNGKQLIDRWRKRDFSPPQAKIKLEAGKLYDIKLEYRENKGKALARLFWSSSRQAKQIIPGNRLFAQNPTEDTTAPIAVSNATPLTQAGGNSYEFTVTYTDQTAVKTATLGDGDVAVQGPKGFSQLAKLVSIDRPTDGTPRTATYRITAPGGSWDPSDDGGYTITLRANQVSDTKGNLIQAGTLGGFQVKVQNSTTPSGGGSSQIVGPLPNITLSRYAGGFSSPADIVNAKDGSNRLYVVEQTGQIRTVQNGVVAATPFLDIRDRLQTGGEQGLLSLAFPPDYASKRHFYVYYTNRNGNVVLSRFQLRAGVNEANPNSETILLTIPHPTYSNHNGGKLAFGPDGYLYVSVGDGGGAGDPNNNAQNPNSLLGKILRLDVESPGVTTYAVPSTNPFLTTTDPNNRYRDEIWALGLRNPWRISFDRQTGDLYIADVGQGQREEVNFQAAASPGGQNYGWNILEGTLPYTNGNSTGFTLPLLEYDRTQGISITGGYVYRGSEFPSLQGAYLYGDFGSGRIWGVRRTATGALENKLLLDSAYSVSSFGEDEQGNLYVADYSTGDIYKVNA